MYSSDHDKKIEDLIKKYLEIDKKLAKFLY